MNAIPTRLTAATVRRPTLTRMLGADARESANDEPDTFAPIKDDERDHRSLPDLARAIDDRDMRGRA
jgi:hypothetical protein